MTEKNRNMIIRLVTGVTLLPGVLTLAWLGGYWFAGLLSFAAGMATSEYLLITHKKLSPIEWAAVLLAAAMPFLPVWRPADAPSMVVGATGLMMFAAWTWHLLRGPLPEAPVRAAHILTAFVYGTGGFTSLEVLRLRPDGGWWVVAALVITWANDTAAYFFGRLFGRHKLYPEVSPGKTWEGFFGGFVGSLGGLFILRGFFFPAMTVVDAVVLGLAGGCFGPAGDLCESMLKRAYGVKDSGAVFPGHGGMLDRTDALIFNAPMVLLYVQFLRG